MASMAGLLPSKPDIDPNDEPRVVGLDSDDADELIDALSSTTTRRVLAALHDEPAAASELAERVDTSLQNVQYHLGKLEDAGLVEVGDTIYSEKGREMNVYVPADRALVVVAGREEETTGLKAALSRLLGGVGVLGVASVLVDRLARRGLSIGLGAPGGADSEAGAGGDGGGDGGAGGQPAPTPETERTGDAGAGGGEAATGTPAETEMETEAATEVATEAPAATPTDTDGFEIAEATGTPTPARDTATAEPSRTALETATPAPEPTLASTPKPTAEPTPVTPEPTGTPTADLATTVAETAAASQPSLVDGLASSPGALFFLGGTTVLLGGFALWWVRQ
jgi:DNA-binding transcriptional ArsR family regulator